MRTVKIYYILRSLYANFQEVAQNLRRTMAEAMAVPPPMGKTNHLVLGLTV